MFEVRRLYDNVLIQTFPTYQAMIDFICQEAADYNYGIYRKWPQNGGECFDTSKNVYIVREIPELD